MKLKSKHKRLVVFLSGMFSIGCALILIIHALSTELIYYKTPSQLLATTRFASLTIRIGGKVAAHSVHYKQTKQTPFVQFEITDGIAAIQVHYMGIVPDLFREGQTVIAIGHLLNKNIFEATQILVKHDETYMPQEVAEALRKSGKWHPEYGPPPDPKTWDHFINPQSINH